MKLISEEIAGYIEKSSWIRKMFEEGARLKKQFGAENIYDFSLGNPDLPPPPEVGEALKDLSSQMRSPFSVGYMPTAGYPETRNRLAAYLSREQGCTISQEDLVLTCGAAGGLNVLFRSVLAKGDEIVCPAPFFVEYAFYAGNHGGRLVPVPALAPDFALDLNGMEKSITEKTRIVLINSPNNPTGKVYSRGELEQLSSLLENKSREYGRPILLVSDEPYRFLVYENTRVPPLLTLYPYSVIVSSFSKSLSLAGERIGYIVPNPEMEGKADLLSGMILANRILGFVNAPGIGQKILERCLDARVDVSFYEKRRAAMGEVLSRAGYSYSMPFGGFYFFPEAPGGDDLRFVKLLQDEYILAVPGTGFGRSGYFRLAFCVDESCIRKSEEGFKRALGKMQEENGGN
ncbi:MAG: pyridoxal phosphate-dependent aminotransferase [Desulfovibrionales bacterium]